MKLIFIYCFYPLQPKLTPFTQYNVAVWTSADACRVWQLHTGGFQQTFQNRHTNREPKKFFLAHWRSCKKVTYTLPDWKVNIVPPTLPLRTLNFSCGFSCKMFMPQQKKKVLYYCLVKSSSTSNLDERDPPPTYFLQTFQSGCSPDWLGHQETSRIYL